MSAQDQVHGVTNEMRAEFPSEHTSADSAGVGPVHEGISDTCEVESRREASADRPIEPDEVLRAARRELGLHRAVCFGGACSECARLEHRVIALDEQTYGDEIEGVEVAIARLAKKP